MADSARISARISFDDNRLLPALFGQQDATLALLEQRLGVSIASRGNVLAISGTVKQVGIAESVLQELYGKLQRGLDFSPQDVEILIRTLSTEGTPMDTPKKQGKHTADKQSGTPRDGKESKEKGAGVDKNLFGTAQWKEMVLKTPKKSITPYSRTQAAYLEAVLSHDLTFAAGPAGTGKTYFAVAVAAYLFSRHEIDRIILSRPAVEAGEKLGFLPGDMKEKVDPYLRPLYDALHDMLPPEKVQRDIANGVIEIAPLAFMRGRTLKHAFIILDEAQNVTPIQMKMFLTRMGEGSKMVITGDMSQTDLPRGEISGLADAMQRLSKIEEIAMIHFTRNDIVRHALTAKIIDAYENN